MGKQDDISRRELGDSDGSRPGSQAEMQLAQAHPDMEQVSVYPGRGRNQDGKRIYHVLLNPLNSIITYL